MNCGLSAAWPAVSTNASGRHLRSAARWTLLVCPPLERPRRAVFSLSFRRRRLRRRSSRPGSASASCPSCSSRLPLLTWPFRLGSSLLQRGEDVLVQVHPGCVVVSARGGGVDADQDQIDLTPLRGFRDQTLQQGLEDTGVTPLPEASGGDEVAVDQARGSLGLPAGDRGDDALAPDGAGDAELAHEALDGAAGHHMSLPVQLAPDLPGPVEAVVGRVDLLDPLLEFLVAHGTGGRSSEAPPVGVLRGRGDLAVVLGERPAERRHSALGLLSPVEYELRTPPVA